MRARTLGSLLLHAALVLLLPAAVRAHDAPAAAEASLRSELHASLTDAETKLIELAEATPAAKFAWTPGEGVRSTSEVFMHVATANYLLPTFVGMAPPEGVNAMTLEKDVKEKDAALRTLRASFVVAHAAIDKPADLDKRVTMFGNEVSTRQTLLLLVTHAHEHLGQSIAYARSNAITPPWTAREKAAAAAKKAEGGK